MESHPVSFEVSLFCWPRETSPASADLWYGCRKYTRTGAEVSGQQFREAKAGEEPDGNTHKKRQS